MESSTPIDESDVMDEPITTIDKELLELTSYDRSKLWATYLENVSKANDDDVLDLNDIENEYYNEHDEEYYSSSSNNIAEEADAAEEEEDNSTYMNEISLVHNLQVSNANGILAQINRRANETGILDTDVQRLLEKTLPIVEAYKREWREAGLERVLNTFDFDKIEDRVGSWMRRNNSKFYRKLSLSPYNRFESCHSQRTHYNYDTDSSDSSHSFDTARYIRSCRKHSGVQKQIATTTTTIRSYRLVESKREELRKKYAYLDTDDTMTVLNAVRCRPLDAIYCARQEHTNNFHKKDKMRLCKKSHLIRKRRHRKPYNCPYSSYSSSDDDDYSARGQSLLKSCCYSRDQHHSRTNKNSANKVYFKMRDKIDDFLPYRQETECSCREADKLCNNARHLANSSTEDWLVENVKSPEKVLQNRDELVPIKKSKRGIAETSNCKTNVKVKKIEQEAVSTAKKVSETKFPNDRETKKDNSKKSSRKSKKQVTKEQSEDSSFEYQLQKAIRLSKQQYDEELKAKSRNDKSKANQSLLKVDLSQNSGHEKSKNHSSTKHIAKEKPKAQADKNRSNTNGNPKVNSIQMSGDEKSNNHLSTKSLAKKEFKIQVENNNSDINSHSDPTYESESSNNHSSTRKPKAQKEVKAKTEKNRSKAISNTEVQTKSNNYSTTKYLAKEELKAQLEQNRSETNDQQNQSNAQKNMRKPSKNKIESLQSNVDLNSNQISKRNKKIVALISSSSSNSSTDGNQNIPRTKRTKKRVLTSIKEMCSEDSDSCKVSDKNEIQPSNTPKENTTFFGNSNKICNSTALANNTANFRQMFISNSTCTAAGVNPIKKNKASEEVETTATTTATKEIQVIDANKEIANKKHTNNVVTKANCTEKRLPADRSLQENHIMSTENNDCTVISSSTDSDLQKTMIQKLPNDRIVLYTPKNRSLIPENSFINGRIKITEDHLASFIGNEKASKFMKVYIKPLEFKQSSTIYYKPPSQDEANCSSDSDVDGLDLCFKYGHLDESKGTIG